MKMKCEWTHQHGRKNTGSRAVGKSAKSGARQIGLTLPHMDCMV